MAIEIQDLDHVVLRVADMDRALRFYRDVLGCREERRTMDGALVQLRAGRSMIDLLDAAVAPGEAGETDAARTPNMDHFALHIDPFDEAALRAHLESHGVEPGEVERRNGAVGFGPSMYIKDPDGNTVELKGPATPGDDD